MKRKFGREFFVVVLSLLGICAALFSWFFAMSTPSLNYDGNAYAGNAADINVMYISYLNHDNVLHATIEITNIVDKKVRVRVTAYNKDGFSLGDVTGITRLKPSETKSIDAHALPPGAETLKIKSNGGIVCNVVFRTTYGKKSEVVPAIREPSRQLDFPALVSYNDLYIYETITLLNPNTTHASVDIVALDKDGYEIDRTVLSPLSSMESKTFSIVDIFGPRILKDLSTVRVNSDSNIMGLQLVDYPAVDLVGIPALTTTSKGWTFPIATKGENFDLWTKAGILNPGNDIANVAVEAYDAGNNSLGIIHSQTILPGVTYLINTANIDTTEGDAIPLNTAILKVTSSQPVIGYEVIGVLNGSGLLAVMGISDEDHTTVGFEITGSMDGGVLSVYSMVRIGGGGVEVAAGNLGSEEWRERLLANNYFVDDVVQNKTTSEPELQTSQKCTYLFSIKGKITLNTLDGPPLSGILVRFEYNGKEGGEPGTSTTTNNNGVFTLSYPGKCGTYTVMPISPASTTQPLNGYVFNKSFGITTVSGSFNFSARPKPAKTSRPPNQPNFRLPLPKLPTSVATKRKYWWRINTEAGGYGDLCRYETGNCGLTQVFADRGHSDGSKVPSFYSLDFARRDSGLPPNVIPILASANGKVINAGWDDSNGCAIGAKCGFGYRVKIQHPDGDGKYETIYAHLADQPLVKETETVVQGQLLGYMGTTGSSDGVHLHFQINHNGKSMSYSDFEKGIPYPALDGIQLEKLRVVEYSAASYYPSTNKKWFVPNGGENWQIGSKQNILWYLPITGNVKIEISRDGGLTWDTDPLFSSTPNDGKEEWIVTGTDNTKAKIRITSLSNTSISDTSDNNFTISGGNTFTIQPGPEGKDTFYGTVYVTNGAPDAPLLYMGGWGDWYYDFFMFDLTGSPSAADTVSATLYLYGSAPNDPVFQLNRITQSWTESGVTLANNPASVFYKNFGSFAVSTYAWNSVDITDLYKNWKNGTYTNYGVKLVPTRNNHTNGEIASSDNDNSVIRPKIIVTRY